MECVQTSDISGNVRQQRRRRVDRTTEHFLIILPWSGFSPYRTVVRGGVGWGLEFLFFCHTDLSKVVEQEDGPLFFLVSFSLTAYEECHTFI